MNMTNSDARKRLAEAACICDRGPETREALAKVLAGIFYITEAAAHDYAATLLDAIDAGQVPGLVLDRREDGGR